MRLERFRYVEQSGGVAQPSDQLGTNREPFVGLAARHADRGVPGDIEQLGEPQGDVPHRLLGASDANGGLTKPGGRHRQGRKQQRIEIFERVIDLAGRSCLVMGMANIGGPGLELVRYFRNRSRAGETAFGKEERV